jgi:selenocysteine lyase/cysteine desulfurase
LIYLDNAASSHPKPLPVYEAMEGALRLGANPGRSGHRLALDAARAVFETRSAVADLLGVGDASRVVFTLNGTHALNQALKGSLRPGDHVVTTTMEHNSVLRT